MISKELLFVTIIVSLLPALVIVPAILPHAGLLHNFVKGPLANASLHGNPCLNFPALRCL